MLRCSDSAKESLHVRDSFALFSFSWAAATLFHVGSVDRWTEAWPLVLAAVWLLWRPGSTTALAALAAVQIDYVFPIGPRTSNHTLFAAAVATAVLLSIATLIVRYRRLSTDRIELFRTFAPSVRWSLIALYFFAAFHKLNADWFDPSVSCGALFYARERQVFPFLPASDTFTLASIYGSLVSEMAITAMLAWRQTRHLGVLTAMVFHWVLAANPPDGFYNFSSMLFAVFTLFLSGPFVSGAATVLGRRPLKAISWMLVALFAGYAFGARPFFGTSVMESRDVFLFLWWIYGTCAIVGLATLTLRRPPAIAGASNAFDLPHPILAAVPVLVFLNGAAPHLGLQTTANWAMYSNLRTEGGRSNHLLVPAGAQVFGYQRDVVQIIRSSVPSLGAEAGRYIPYFELRREPQASVTYVRRGVRYRYPHVAEDPAFREIPRLAAALMVFRAFDRGVKQPCVH